MLPPLAIASITVLVVWSSGPPVAAICTPFVYSRKADTLCVDGLATSVNSNCSSLNFSSIFGFCEVAELNDLVALETRVRILGFNGSLSSQSCTTWGCPFPLVCAPIQDTAYVCEEKQTPGAANSLVRRTAVLSQDLAAAWHVLYTYTSSPSGPCPYIEKVNVGPCLNSIIQTSTGGRMLAGCRVIGRVIFISQTHKALFNVCTWPDTHAVGFYTENGNPNPPEANYYRCGTGQSLTLASCDLPAIRNGFPGACYTTYAKPEFFSG